MDIFYKYFFDEEEGCLYTCPEHVLVFVFSGELEISCGSLKKTVRKGECIFLRKDVSTMLVRKLSENEPFGSIFMGFSHNFLCKFHHRMNKKNIPPKTGKFRKNIIELPHNPYMESIYISLMPYYQMNKQPLQQVMELKMMEAVFGLLLTDERFYSCLFGFLKHSKPGYPCQESFAGQYIVSQKLETAYISRQQENNMKEIYIEVGYRNVARFIKLIN